MAEQFGIDKLKEASSIIASTINATDASLSNGFQGTDIFTIILQLSPLPQLLQAKDDIKNQWKDLSDAEIPELIADFNSKLNLKDKDLQGKIQKAITAAGSVAIAIKAFNKAKDAVATQTPQ